MTSVLHQPLFPWFGGKSSVADRVWNALGNVMNYVEPFCGSLAVLLLRPGGAGHIETVNDADGLLANFWRALQHDSDAVAAAADNPVNEADLHARHVCKFTCPKCKRKYSILGGKAVPEKKRSRHERSH